MITSASPLTFLNFSMFCSTGFPRAPPPLLRRPRLSPHSRPCPLRLHPPFAANSSSPGSTLPPHSSAPAAIAGVTNLCSSALLNLKPSSSTTFNPPSPPTIPPPPIASRTLSKALPPILVQTILPRLPPKLKPRSSPSNPSRPRSMPCAILSIPPSLPSVVYFPPNPQPSAISRRTPILPPLRNLSLASKSFWRLTMAMRPRSEEHTSELQSHVNLVCRLLLDTPTTDIYTLPLHDAPPISRRTPILPPLRNLSLASKSFWRLTMAMRP